jgi:anti-sigma B factor antagonist
MLETQIAHHLRVQDRPESDSTVLKPLDEHMNYAHADLLKSGLKQAAAERLEKGCRRFVLDLSGVNVMDSCGLSVLISVKKLLDQQGARLVMAGPSPMIRRLLVITKLDRVFEIESSVDDAITLMA